MKHLRAIIVVVAALSSAQALACRVPNHSLAERAALSEQILFGRVLSLSMPPLESAEPEEYSSHRLNRFVRVLVQETYKGQTQEIVEFELHWCGGNWPTVEVGRKILAFKHRIGGWYVEQHKEITSKIRQQIQRFEH